MRHNSKPKGDTLIEVLFAFAILSSVMAIAFNASIASFKSAQSASRRSQATFLAQYQADALKTYRDSLDWNNELGNNSFLDGIDNDPKTKVRSFFIKPNEIEFCIIKAPKPGPGDFAYWKIQTNLNDCKNVGSVLAPKLAIKSMKITPKDLDEKIASFEVKIEYNPGSGASDLTDTVTNTVVLTK